jgi:hypothetical protein
MHSGASRAEIAKVQVFYCDFRAEQMTHLKEATRSAADPSLAHSAKNGSRTRTWVQTETRALTQRKNNFPQRIHLCLNFGKICASILESKDPLDGVGIFERQLLVKVPKGVAETQRFRLSPGEWHVQDFFRDFDMFIVAFQ